MTKSAHQDHFDKLCAEWDEAHKDVLKTYNLWQSACARLHRIAKMRNEAFNELLETRS